jgi:diguanylate cyclase (GGDEF)-like protein
VTVRATSSTAPVVLVAEDEASQRALLRQQLEPHAYRVVEASDGPSALEACRTHRPDVVLLDLGIPGMDGHDLLAALKTDMELVDTPVVVITGLPDVTRALKLGAHDYVRKPYEVTELVARVTAALRTKQLHDELRRREAQLDDLVRKDSLTGLANRRNLDEHLRMLGGAARRHHAPLSVLIIDLDNFRRVNESEGHAVGDGAVRAVGARIVKSLRAEDVAGRWGGDEFLVLLPATDLDGAWVLADRIRQAVLEPIVIGEGSEVVVTASVGCATGDGTDPEGLVRRAEAALERARRSGLNQIGTDPGL